MSNYSSPYSTLENRQKTLFLSTVRSEPLANIKQKLQQYTPIYRLKVLKAACRNKDYHVFEYALKLISPVQLDEKTCKLFQLSLEYDLHIPAIFTHYLVTQNKKNFRTFYKNGDQYQTGYISPSNLYKRKLKDFNFIMRLLSLERRYFFMLLNLDEKYSAEVLITFFKDIEFRQYCESINHQLMEPMFEILTKYRHSHFINEMKCELFEASCYYQDCDIFESFITNLKIPKSEEIFYKVLASSFKVEDNNFRNIRTTAIIVGYLRCRNKDFLTIAYGNSKIDDLYRQYMNNKNVLRKLITLERKYFFMLNLEDIYTASILKRYLLTEDDNDHYINLMRNAELLKLILGLLKQYYGQNFIYEVCQKLMKKLPCEIPNINWWYISTNARELHNTSYENVDGILFKININDEPFLAQNIIDTICYYDKEKRTKIFEFFTERARKADQEGRKSRFQNSIIQKKPKSFRDDRTNQLLRHIAMVLYLSTTELKEIKLQEVQVMLVRQRFQLPSLFIAFNPNPDYEYEQSLIITHIKNAFGDIGDYEEPMPPQRHTMGWYKKKTKRAFNNYSNSFIKDILTILNYFKYKIQEVPVKYISPKENFEITVPIAPGIYIIKPTGAPKRRSSLTQPERKKTGIPNNRKFRHSEEYLCDVAEKYKNDDPSIICNIYGKKRPCLTCKARMTIAKIDTFNKNHGFLWTSELQHQSDEVTKETMRILLEEKHHETEGNYGNEYATDSDSGDDMDEITDLLNRTL